MVSALFAAVGLVARSINSSLFKLLIEILPGPYLQESVRDGHKIGQNWNWIIHGRDYTRCFSYPLSFLLGPTLISDSAVVDIPMLTAPQLKHMLCVFVRFSASRCSPTPWDPSQPKYKCNADTWELIFSEATLNQWEIRARTQFWEAFAMLLRDPRSFESLLLRAATTITHFYIVIFLLLCLNFLSPSLWLSGITSQTALKRVLFQTSPFMGSQSNKNASFENWAHWIQSQLSQISRM